MTFRTGCMQRSWHTGGGHSDSQQWWVLHRCYSYFHLLTRWFWFPIKQLKHDDIDVCQHGRWCDSKLGYDDATTMWRYWDHFIMMTSSNGNIFRVTGHLCGEFTDPGEFPAQRPVTRNFDIFFDLRLNKRLIKQSWGWWFEMQSHPLWRHCNDSIEIWCSISVIINVVVFRDFCVLGVGRVDWSYVPGVMWQSNRGNHATVKFALNFLFSTMNDRFMIGWCRGLTTCFLYVGPVFGKSILYELACKCDRVMIYMYCKIYCKIISM